MKGACNRGIETTQPATKVCSKCKEEKLSTNFYRSSGRTKDGLHPWCTPCTLAYNREYIRRNPEENRARARKSRIHAKYGITWVERDELIAAQGNQCAICRNEFRDSRDTHVDHDHETGKVRAILCFTCNSGLGNFKDDAELALKAHDYLVLWKERHAS